MLFRETIRKILDKQNNNELILVIWLYLQSKFQKNNYHDPTRILQE